jgi:hypothetical protein
MRGVSDPEMKLDPDNKSGMWICNALMIRKDVTDEEKKVVTGIQRDILAKRDVRLEPSEDQYFWLRRLWWRGKRDGKQKSIKVRITETTKLNSYGTKYISAIIATCMDCGHKVEVFGTGEASKKRAAATLRQECPYRERNFYEVECDGRSD